MTCPEFGSKPKRDASGRLVCPECGARISGISPRDRLPVHMEGEQE